MNTITMSSRFQILLDYCRALANLSELLFVVVFFLVSTTMSSIAEYSLAQLGFPKVPTVELLVGSAAGLFFLVVVFGPPTETLLLQQLPVSVARRFGMPLAFQFAIGSIPFAALHFSSGIASGVAAGVVGGAVFSLAYVTFISESKMKAFCITTAVHSLHNFAAFLIYIRDLP